ncbi:MAG TPA: DUF6776 family protein [Steroidobacteraceae bacterium]|nr:DUF6776 family protein [Steroidobacteraceae bacterium]
MSDTTRMFVIRPHTPVRTVLLRIAVVLIGLFALYVLFEFGRYSAGYDRARVAEERRDHRRQVATLDAEIQNLHSQVAQLQTLQAGAAREHEQVALEIAELQAQIDRDRQDLAVYRGVVAPASAAGSSMQVQQLRIAPAGGAGAFVAHLTLMQGGKPDATVNGVVAVRVSGQLNGAASAVDAVGNTPRGSVSFKYYQAVDYHIALPAGFRPATVQVTLRDGRPNGITTTQSFPWSVDVQP